LRGRGKGVECPGKRFLLFNFDFKIFCKYLIHFGDGSKNKKNEGKELPEKPIHMHHGLRIIRFNRFLSHKKISLSI